MKYYIASYNGPISDGMTYNKYGDEEELFQLFPELKEIVSRLPLRSIDLRMANGDRVRIYNIHHNNKLDQ